MSKDTSSKQQFQFRHFTIHQDRCAMKVGVDAVLLGAWCPLPEQSHPTVLDIGAGTGILSLQLAQRMKNAQITAVEIDDAAAKQASENIEASPYAERIRVVTNRVQSLSAKERSFDLIICNPPFFSGGVLSEQMERNAARHTVKLSHGDLLASVRKFLAPDGSFSLVLPKIEALRFQELAIGVGLYPKEVLNLRPREGKPVHRILQSFIREKGDIREVELVQYGEGQKWTEEFNVVVKAFYLD